MYKCKKGVYHIGVFFGIIFYGHSGLKRFYDMGRLKKYPNYEPDRIMRELMDVVSGIYAEKGELQATAEEIGLSALKVRKILVTAGVFENEIADEVNRLYRDGKSPVEIQEITGLGRSSVNGYLPYVKALYNTKEVSANAERIRLFRERKACVDALLSEWNEEVLWQAVVLFQNYRFLTMRGLPFSYVLKVGRNGQLNKELIVSRRKESKTLAWSSVKLAFEKSKELQGEIVTRPKQIGDIRGISYIYAMFLRFGIVKGG